MARPHDREKKIKRWKRLALLVDTAVPDDHPFHTTVGEMRRMHAEYDFALDRIANLASRLNYRNVLMGTLNRSMAKGAERLRAAEDRAKRAEEALARRGA